MIKFSKIPAIAFSAQVLSEKTNRGLGPHRLLPTDDSAADGAWPETSLFLRRIAR